VTEDPRDLPEEVGELLSALVDGELSAEERAEAEAWLTRSAAARAAYDDLTRVKAALRGLPAVDPPLGFFDRVLRRRSPARSRSWAASPAALVASGVATAAAWLVLGGAGADRLVPPIDDLAVEASTADSSVTLLRQDGSVDWDALPDGTRSDVGGTDVWVSTGDGVTTLIADRDGAVYTMVSEELSPAGLVALVEGLPSGDGGSILTRARNACRALVETFVWSP
jgi:anti-sigma factor RsiW